MRDISDALDLIATARDALLNDLLPNLQKDQRYIALMIANALAIAQREQRSGMEVTRNEIGRLVNLLTDGGIEAAPSGGDDAASELSVLRRTLCSAIRHGGFDDASHSAALAAHLDRTSADWLAISNPKALQADRVAGKMKSQFLQRTSTPETP